ncbi:hypothetical protein ACOSQ2_025482 [Xanthoceras sorbifolium]
MKCCSLKRKDLNFHFKKMSHKYYMLNDLNDETLRQVYINSLPDELQADIHRHIASTRRDLRNTSLANGELFTTKLITKKTIIIQFFPGCIIWSKFIGSPLSGKDLLLRWDTYCQFVNLKTGLTAENRVDTIL